MFGRSKQRLWTSLLCGFALAVTISFFSPSLVLAAFSTPPLPSEPNGRNSWQPEVTTEEEAYYVFELDRGNTLFEKEAQVLRQGPLSVNIMLAVQSLENLDNKIPVTISQGVADRSRSENILAIDLRAGEKYSPEFLLYSVLFYDSKASAQALMEALAENTETLATRMNDRARVLGMDQTNYVVTGDGIRANSTLADLAVMMRQAMGIERFRNIMLAKSQIFLQDVPKAAMLENRMAYAWSFTNNRFYGALLAKDSYIYTTVYLSRGDDYSICILQSSSHNPNFPDPELIAMAVAEAVVVAEAVYAGYERTRLVARGEHCKDIVQQDGITVHLVYLDSVYFLKPLAGDFQPTLQLSVSDTIPLPILADERLGQMTFTMPDNSRYVVNVGSNEDIFSQNTTLERLLTAMRDYSEIMTLVIVLGAVLLIIGLIKLVRQVVRLLILRRHDPGRHRRG